MALNISPDAIKWSIALVVLVLFSWVCVSGIIAGKDLARSRAAIERTSKLQEGLRLFYADQDRYPSELEYADGVNLSVYLENFPGPEFTHKKWCQVPPRYQSSGGASFDYTFCTTRKFKDWPRGWHIIDERTSL